MLGGKLMFVKIVGEICSMHFSFNIFNLFFSISPNPKKKLKDLRELSLKSNRILSELRETPGEDLKKDETFSDTIHSAHQMIFNLENLLCDKDLQDTENSEVKNYLEEIYKNVQKIYLILTEDFSQEDKKNYIKICIDMFKCDYEKSERINQMAKIAPFDLT